MNYRLIFKTLGNVLMVEAVSMAPAIAASVFYGGGDAAPLCVSLILTAAAGIILSGFARPEDNTFQKREGFVTVSLAWLALSFFGALPYYFASMPGQGFAGCFFESVSGFTGTGLTVAGDLSQMPRGIMFWRCFTNWLGGMGVLVMVLAIMPTLRPSAITLMYAESSGPSQGRLVPRIRDTAKIMYKIYAALTAAQIVILTALGMPFYDAALNTFASAGTGGFSPQNLSIGAYGGAPIEMVTAVFILIFGINFSLLYYFSIFDFKTFFADQELRLYGFVTLLSTLAITINIKFAGVYESVWTAFRYAFFQVATFVTTTGFTSTDFSGWPAFSQALLIFLMMLGGCAGSTAGGIKMVRALVACKAIKHELNKILHPRMMRPITINGKAADAGVLSNIYVFFIMYMGFMALATFVLALEGEDLVSTFMLVISSITNVGVDPRAFSSSIANVSGFAAPSKFMLCLCMLVGRLEFYPVLVLLIPSVWRK
ncbi:MAG: TrkH family potassium uptake protein [Clostridiales bacterium]|jgi:trk system potassium uptake protein TrkH|nr:TrkH family potassium uptake protein [Clostridiales bacterium]